MKPPRQVDADRRFQVENDGALCLAENRVQFGGAAGVATTRRFDLDDVGAHRGPIPGRGRSRDDPAEIEHPHAGQRQFRSRRLGFRRAAIARSERQTERITGGLYRAAGDIAGLARPCLPSSRRPTSRPMMTPSASSNCTTTLGW